MKDLQRSLPVQVSRWSCAHGVGVNVGCGAPPAAPALQGHPKSVQKPLGLPGAAAGPGGVWIRRGGGKRTSLWNPGWGSEKRETTWEWVSSLRNKRRNFFFPLNNFHFSLNQQMSICQVLIFTQCPEDIPWKLFITGFFFFFPSKETMFSFHISSALQNYQSTVLE